jgi:hypothetical protein
MAAAKFQATSPTLIRGALPADAYERKKLQVGSAPLSRFCGPAVTGIEVNPTTDSNGKVRL